MRKLSLVLLVAVLALPFAVMPASAQPAAGTIIFRGVAWSPGLCYPGVEIVRGDCAKQSVSSLKMSGFSDVDGDGIYTAGTDFDHNSPANFCAAYSSVSGLAVKAPDSAGGGGIGSCDLQSSGIVKGGPAGSGLIGAYCGASYGRGLSTSTVNGTQVTEQYEWMQSAATLLPITDGNLTNSLYIAGVVDAIGAVSGGSCGVNGPPSVGFNVVGISVAVTTG